MEYWASPSEDLWFVLRGVMGHQVACAICGALVMTELKERHRRRCYTVAEVVQHRREGI
jgi:hypothetical protein